jgi:hypothetical protein
LQKSIELFTKERDTMEETLQQFSKQNSEAQAVIDSLQKDLTTKFVFSLLYRISLFS